MKTKLRSSLTLVLATAAFAAPACTGFIVGRKASGTGRVIVAHNEDNGGPLVLRHALVPRTSPGPLFEQDGRATIPPAAEAASFFWSEVVSRKGNPPPGDLFLNEHGVLVFSNNGGVQKEWLGERWELPDEGAYSTCTDGGLGHNLRLAVAERAQTAREGVGIITNLVSAWGYANPSRLFTVADRDEAWIVEVIRGRRYVARRCPDDAVMAYPNCLTVGRIEPGDICSPNIAAKGADFDFIAAYQGPRTWKSPYNLHRWQDFYRLAAGVDVPVGDAYPFSVRPAHPVSVADIQKGLTSHYEGRPYEVKERHPEKDQRIVVPICRASTMESIVCAFGETPRDTVLHIATGCPCETPYAVCRPFAGDLPADAATGREAVGRIGSHCRPFADKSPASPPAL